MLEAKSRQRQRRLRVSSRVLFAATVCALTLLIPLIVHASFGLKVIPLPIVIEGGGTSTTIELRNEGSTPMSLQAQTFEWDQSSTGEDILNPTRNLLVFPSMVKIPPGKSKKVRVGTQSGYETTETPFRLIFSQIPESSNGAADTPAVNMVARVSVPVFVKPAGTAPRLEIMGLTTTKERVAFRVLNRGTSHARLGRVAIRFVGQGGRTIGEKEVPGWYVLPGKSRPYEIPIGPDNGVSCTGATTMIVTISGAASASAAATLPQPRCAG